MKFYKNQQKGETSLSLYSPIRKRLRHVDGFI
ncbi:hypothetical protein LVISKB_2264 [Levilactobacillus brevis KB290]|uniref:Uncharacterized protein n=1 Tax=Levilactobacillus brevis KB290 TaxID=1001583 RepID=M5AGC7_LEVBR|nr:hypothetical protein LVISKB_2264 [Levilactobacillus brevis KB290]